jgi:hypothetical protein
LTSTRLRASYGFCPSLGLGLTRFHGSSWLSVKRYGKLAADEIQ